MKTFRLREGTVARARECDVEGLPQRPVGWPFRRTVVFLVGLDLLPVAVHRVPAVVVRDPSVTLVRVGGGGEPG